MTNTDVNRMTGDALTELVDLEAYPIDQPDSDRYREVVAAARSGLRTDGCAVIKDLVCAEALEVLGREIWDRKHATHFSTQVMNPYFHTAVDDRYDTNHPVNTFLERSSGFIPGDSWEDTTAMRRLFETPALCRFLADCLEIPELHPYADPLAGLTANILDPGQLFTWHFDTNEFAVTVLVEEADEGGLFEYVPNIRSGDDEGFDKIGRVLNGGREGVYTLDLRPGDLQIFRGRYSLHQVSRVPVGSKPRHAAIFAYTEQPGVIGRVARTQQLFGRVLPAHIEAEEARVRADALLD
ncbi:MAG: arpA protein [Actinomycetota bacterium]